jgi:hypothetical protein
MAMKKVLLALSLFLFILSGLTAQCCPDRHSTNAHDGWLSCSPSINPVPGLGNSHWIRYDFGQVHSLHQSIFWNINDPDRLADNIQRARIDYSTSGTNWTFYGIVDFIQATGNPKYEGFTGPDFGGVSARYMVITPIQNFGGSCFGFSEMKIFTEPSEPTAFVINLNPCINDGVQYGIAGGLLKGGTYSGSGVVNSYEDKFDFDPDLAGPGRHTVSYQYQENGNLFTETAIIDVDECGTGSCGPCPPCSQVYQPILDGNPIQNGTFYKSPELNSEGVVNANYDINFRGAQSVNMQEGFEVEKNALFLAEIRKCTEVPVDNLLVNGDFEAATMSPWVIEKHQTADATMSLETNPAHILSGNASAKVVTTSTTNTSWHLQFKNTGASVEVGKSYVLTFAAKADKNVDVGMSISRNNSPWNGYDDMFSVMTTEWQFFTLPFVPDEDNNGNLRVAARLSNIPTGTYWFDDFVLIQQ